jgi:hypothetical protein
MSEPVKPSVLFVCVKNAGKSQMAAGPALVAGAVAVLVRAAVGRVSGYWVGTHVPRRIVIPVAVAALAALEVNQQLHVALLTQPWGGS